MSETPLTLIQPKVIDPDDQAEMERFDRLHNEAWKRVRDRHPDRVGTPTWEITAEQFRLFRDPTYRAKPDEPTGLGAVVEDEDGSILTRISLDGGRDWVTIHGTPFEWSEIDVARILGSGVQP